MSKDGSNTRVITYKEFESMLHMLSDEQYYALEVMGVVEFFQEYEALISKTLQKGDYKAVQKVIEHHSMHTKVSDDVNFIVDYKTILRKECYSKNLIAILNNLTPLRMSSMNIISDIMHAVLDRSNIGSDVSYALLQCILIHDDSKSMKYFIQSGYNINSNNGTMTLLMSSVYAKNFKVANCLVELGADVNLCNPLLWGIMKNRIDILEFFIDHKANINQIDEDGYTPLMIAVQSGSYDIVKYLTDRGANVNICNDEGKTSLIYAAVKKDFCNAVNCLIINGAEPEILDNDGMSAFIYAVGFGYFDTVKCFVGHKVNIDIKDINGCTALMHSIRNEHFDIMKYLLEVGVNVNASDNTGNTALLYAMASKRCFEVIECLMRYKADLDICNNEGRTLLLYASISGNIELSECLLKYGANPNIVDYDRKTPLIYACISGNVELAECLLKYRACLEVESDDGTKSLNIDEINCPPHVLELIKKDVVEILGDGVDIKENI